MMQLDLHIHFLLTFLHSILHCPWLMAWTLYEPRVAVLPTFFQAAATVSPPLPEVSDPPAADCDSLLIDESTHFSFPSSWFISCCRHSRLQKATSPLVTWKESIQYVIFGFISIISWLKKNNILDLNLLLPITQPCLNLARSLERILRSSSAKFQLWIFQYWVGNKHEIKSLLFGV